MMIKLRHSRNSVNSILSLFSIFFMLLTLYFSVANRIKYPFWVIALVYSVGINMIRKNNIVSFTPGIITLNIVMFCRYAILPLFLCMSDELSRFAMDYGSVDEAVWLMAYELVFVLGALYLSGSKKKRKQTESKEVNFYVPKYGTIIALLVTMVVGFIAVRYSIFSGGLSLVTSGISNVVEDTLHVSGFITILWQAGLAWLYINLCMKIKQRDYSGSILLLIVLILSVGYILLTFVGQTSISRWYTVVTFVAVYFSLIKLFPRRIKNITLSILVPVVLLIVVVSVYKNSSFLGGGISFKEGFLELFDISTLDSYFAGPVSVNNAIRLKESTNVGFFSLFFDIVNNMPVINHMVDLSNSTLKMYVEYMHRGDQIIPLVGQSAIYFTYLFAPLLSVSVVYIIRRFDRAYLNSSTAIFYAYGFAAAWMGLAMILNTAITLSWFYNRIIPLMLLIKAVEGMGVINMRKRRYYGVK